MKIDTTTHPAPKTQVVDQETTMEWSYVYRSGDWEVDRPDAWQGAKRWRLVYLGADVEAVMAEPYFALDEGVPTAWLSTLSDAQSTAELVDRALARR